MLPNLHILGVQGSGKGTQVSALVKKFDFTAVSTGELFRQRATVGDAYGEYIRTHLDAGELLTAQDLVAILTTYLDDTQVGTGILGDGVLRTVEQWEMLKPLWPTYNLGEPVLLYLELDDATARERIVRRYGLEGRSDDLPAAVERRIQLFHEKTMQVVDLFTSHGRAAHINALGEVDEVTGRITEAIHQFYPEFKQSI
jgi:adenylate kinase